MGTVVEFKPLTRTTPVGGAAGPSPDCQIVIFPGVRIERHAPDLDLSHRLRDSAGRDDFVGISSRPRRTS